MAKVSAVSTLSPTVFSLGNAVYFEDLLEVIEQQNYSAAEHVQRFDYSKAPLAFTGSNVVLRGHFWVPAWLKTLSVTMETSGGGTFAPELNIGAATQAFTSNTTDTRSITTSGVGIVLFTVTGELTSGSGQLDSLHIETVPLSASALPTPPDE